MTTEIKTKSELLNFMEVNIELAVSNEPEIFYENAKLMKSAALEIIGEVYELLPYSKYTITYDDQGLSIEENINGLKIVLTHDLTMILIVPSTMICLSYTTIDSQGISNLKNDLHGLFHKF